MVKKTKAGDQWFFVDESGDPTFYDQKGNLIVGTPGCSPILILGLIQVNDPAPMRQEIQTLQQKLIDDPYFQGFPSLQRTAVAFHAKDDLPEIRYAFFKLISKLEFRAQFIVARKIERVFRSSFQSSETAFYDHLVSKLFEGKLHTHQNNMIYYAKRGSRSRQVPLLSAIQKSVRVFEEKWKITVSSQITIQAQSPKGEPCLSVMIT
jgi:hypothetical protein